MQVGPATVRITASLGLAELSATDAEPLERAIERADDAQYAAKRAGRDRVEVAGARRQIYRQ